MTTLNTGWTPDVSPKPATLPQLRALLLKLQGMSGGGKVGEVKRDFAIDALDNAIDCLVEYRKWLEFAEDAEADALDRAADVQERADLYAMGMGR